MPKDTTKRSSTTIFKERTEAGAKVLEMRNLLTGDKKDFTPQEQAEWESRNKVYNDLDSEYQRAKQFEKIEADSEERNDAGGVGQENFLPPELRHLSKKGQKAEGERQQQTAEQRKQDQDLAMSAWFIRQHGLGLTKRHVEACKRVGFNPNSKRMDFSLLNTENARYLQKPYQLNHPSQSRFHAEKALERRDFDNANPAAGGVLVNPTFASSLELAMLDFSGVLQTSEVITTSTGAELRWPTGNDTSNKGRLLGAGAAVTADSTTPFASKSWFAYKFSSDLIKVDQELIEDNSFNLPAVISGMLGERLGRIFNDYGTTGNGANEPEGIVTGASQGKETASQTVFTAAELIDMQHSIDPAYRNGAAWMMHDTILAAVRKLQDSQNRFYINFIDGLREGVPDRLLGQPIFINQSMASTQAQSAKIMLYGQLSKYKVRRVNAVRMYRLQERYRDNDQDGFVAFVRMDGKLLNAGVAPVKYLQNKTT